MTFIRDLLAAFAGAVATRATKSRSISYGDREPGPPKFPLIIGVTAAAMIVGRDINPSEAANNNIFQLSPKSPAPIVRDIREGTAANDNEVGVDDASGNAHVPASIRFNNPGAQYPAEWAKAFGMDGYGVIGGGHLIAHFPDPVAGAAANMFLLNKSYAGMTIGAAGIKWTGRNGFGVPGYNPNTVLTREMLDDQDFMIPFMKAIAGREAGRKSPLTDDQWISAFQAFQAGKYSN